MKPTFGISTSFAILLLLSGGLTANAEPVPSQATTRGLPNILLLSVDTLRADALTAYGYPYDTSPTVGRLARRGVLFEDTISTIGKTGPAMSSLFTSLYPPTHGARRNGVALRPDVPVLAEILAEEGYQTAAFISNWTLRARLSGTDRGFQTYDEDFSKNRYLVGPSERSAPSLTAAALDWLKANRVDTDQPLFLWVHYSEPHSPYKLHKELAPPKPRNADHDRFASKRWRYASEVAYLDQWIDTFLEGAEKYLPAKDTLIVFVADHGESIGEHDYWGHGKNTHWPNLQIPLILAGPGLPEGKRVSGPASIVDVMPTVLELLNIESPKSVAGISLVESWSRGINPGRFRYSFGDRSTALGDKSRKNYGDPLQISLQSRNVKAIYDFTQRTVRYFDLSKDLQESTPLLAPPEGSDPLLRRQLVNWYKSLAKYEHEGDDELDDEDLEQLEALGYVGGGGH
jgi:arylsulfatase A-like enzyme